MQPEFVLLIVRTVAPIPLAWLFVLLFWFALSLPARPRLFVLMVMFPAMWSLPLLVPPHLQVWRALTAMGCSTLWLKSYDVYYGMSQHAPRPTFAGYLLFHLNPCSLVERMMVYEPQPPLTANIIRVLRGVLVSLIGAGAFLWVRRGSEEGWPFWLEHSAKTVVAFGITYGLSEIITGVCRLWGLRARTLISKFFLARTPAEYWRLYNRYAGQFILEDIVEPIHRRIAPGPAITLAFGLSGLWHEYMVSMAIGRVQLLMTSCFLLQGIAVAATYRLRPRGGWAVVAFVATVAFNLATAVLFFTSINQFVPWYSGRAPLWVRPRY